jgi:hypothetical protein|nr:MAG TPA: hypothetical protein [Crassvirales sp.]
MSTKSKTENKPMPALMSKTKAQLVDIILRKDNIECGLRNDIKSKDCTLNDYKDKLDESIRNIETVKHEYETFKAKHQTLKAEFEHTCDENASAICELKETIINKNSIIIKLSIGLIASFVIMLCLCCL